MMQLYIMMKGTGRAYSLTRLANIMGCSRQTILRMIEQLQRIPNVECDTWLDKHERFFQMTPQHPDANMLIHPETLRHLALCRDIVGHLLPATVQQELRKTLDGAPRAKPGTTFAEPWAKGRIDYSPFHDILEDIQTALDERRLCRIAYHPRNGAAPMRRLAAPLLIIAYREALYLRCRLYDAPGKPADKYRTLAIHRIKSLRLETATHNDVSKNDRDPHFGFPFHEPIRVKVASAPAPPPTSPNAPGAQTSNSSGAKTAPSYSNSPPPADSRS